MKNPIKKLLNTLYGQTAKDAAKWGFYNTLVSLDLAENQPVVSMDGLYVSIGPRRPGPHK